MIPKIFEFDRTFSVLLNLEEFTFLIKRVISLLKLRDDVRTDLRLFSEKRMQ